MGKILHLGGHNFTVIGVMPSSFRLPTTEVQLWLSIADVYESSGNAGIGNWITDRRLRGYGVLGRLKDAVSVAQAQVQLNSLEQRLAQSFPKEDNGLGV